MKKKVEVTLPTTPNFIKVGNGYISVLDFTEKELKEIGRKWTEELIAKRRKKSFYPSQPR